MKLYLVVPCYNEEAVLTDTSEKLKQKMQSLMAAGKISEDSRIVYVNDGSKDKTWDMICALHDSDPLFRGIKLSRNRGHQNALLAGLMTVRRECDATISLDADLQDDINAIDKMVDAYAEGYEVVYGVRNDRTKDSFMKRTTAQGFYRFMQMMGVETIYNHADYRLMSSRALEALSEYKEANLFLRGMVPLVGFKSTSVEYERGVRLAGESKYNISKMLGLAIDGITSMSVRPIRLLATIGAILSLICFGFLIFFIVRLICGLSVSGTGWILISVWGFGGIQLMALGIVGEYVGKIYLESKHRPRFIVEEYLTD